jgi:nucleoid-associated protein YgaU
MRLRRVSDRSRPAPSSRVAADVVASPVTLAGAGAATIRAHQLIGGGRELVRRETYAGGERLDEIAHRYLGDPRQWRLLATFNDIDNPLRLLQGRTLRIPLLT